MTPDTHLHTIGDPHCHLVDEEARREGCVLGAGWVKIAVVHVEGIMILVQSVSRGMNEDWW